MPERIAVFLKLLGSYSGFFIICACLGCNGDGNSSDLPTYAGVWDVQYNFVNDDCGLALQGIPGFFDQHIIEQTERSILLSAQSGLIVEATGEVREDNSMFVAQDITGDILGQGVPCTLSTSISYEVPKDNKSDTLFTQSIACDDGFFCETTAVGEASLQESS